MVKGGRSGQGASTGRVDGGVAALRPGAGVEATGSGWSLPSGWTAPLSRRSRTSMWWPPSGLGAPTSTHPPIAMDAIEGSGCRHRRRGARCVPGMKPCGHDAHPQVGPSRSTHGSAGVGAAPQLHRFLDVDRTPGFPLTWAEVKGKRQGHGRWSRGGTEAGQGGGEPAQCRWARAAGGRRQQMLAGGRLGVWHAPLHLPPTLRAAFRFGLSRPGGAHCVGGRLGVAHWGWLAGGRHPMARPALHRVGTKVCAEPRMESTLHSVGGLRRRLPTPVHWIGWSTSSGWAGPIAGCSGPSALRPRAAPSTHTSVHCDGRHREVVLKPRTPITPARCSARPGARPGGSLSALSFVR